MLRADGVVSLRTGFAEGILGFCWLHAKISTQAAEEWAAGLPQTDSPTKPSSPALFYKLRDRPIFLAELFDAGLVMVNPADRTEDQPATQHDQTKVQKHLRQQERHHLLHAVIARGRYKRAQHR